MSSARSHGSRKRKQEIKGRASCVKSVIDPTGMFLFLVFGEKRRLSDEEVLRMVFALNPWSPVLDESAHRSRPGVFSTPSMEPKNRVTAVSFPRKPQRFVRVLGAKVDLEELTTTLQRAGGLLRS